MLIALAASLTSSFLSGSDRKEFTVNLGQISALLRNARRQAIVTGIEQEVKLATAIADAEPADENEAPSPPDWIEPGMQLRYAATLDDSLEETAEIAVIFFPMGSSTGGLIELSDGERSTHLYVSPFSGKLMIESRLADLEDRLEQEPL